MRLAQWCQQFSPTVGLEESPVPESLLLDVTGLGPLFGGEEGLVEQVGREFRRRGFVVRVALADTIGAAWAVAHYAAPGARCGVQNVAEPIVVPPGQALAALEPLPVEALRLSPAGVEVLRELGLGRIGQLASLARPSLPSRFGPELLQRLDQAAGRVAEVIRVEQPPPEIQAEWSFEQPADRYELVEWAVRQQVERISGELWGRRRGVQQLECRLRCQTGAVVNVSVGLFRPTAAARHLFELVRMRLAQLTLREPVSAVQVLVTATAPLECRQQELFAGSSRRDDPRQLALLVDRLSSRLGRESVVRPRLLADAQPECAWRYEPLIGGFQRGSRRSQCGTRNAERGMRNVEGGARSGSFSAARLSRPLRLAPQPAPLVVVSIVPDGPPLVFHWRGGHQRVARAWGPERIETGWWRGRPVRRDYYRVETATGQWFWLFRQLGDGRWFLHGTFD